MPRINSTAKNKQQPITIPIFAGVALIVTAFFYLLPYIALNTSGIAGLVFQSLFTPFPYIVFLILWFFPSYLLLQRFGWKYPAISLGLAFVAAFPITVIISFFIPFQGDVWPWISVSIMFTTLLLTHRIPSPALA